MTLHDTIATLNYILDFSTDHVPSPTEFSLKLAFMIAVWISILGAIKKACLALAKVLWSHPIPLPSASIPSTLPHKNPPGSAIPFDIPLLKASDEQIETFMSFRGKAGWFEKNSSKGEGEREWALQRVASCSAAYKGELYEERTMKWIDDHFRLKLPHLKYPYVDRHW